jgi:hypothetical protein
MGLTTEAAGLALSTEKEEELQRVVYQTYKDVVKAFVRDNQHVDVLVFDRSAYDYVGYQLTRFPNWSSPEVYALQDDLKKFYEETVKEVHDELAPLIEQAQQNSETDSLNPVQRAVKVLSGLVGKD